MDLLTRALEVVAVLAMHSAFVCGVRVPGESEGISLESRERWGVYRRDVLINYFYKNPGIQRGCSPTLDEHQGEYKGTIMLLHGFTACPQQFDLLVPELNAAGFTTLRPVLPGTGLNWTSHDGKIYDKLDLLPEHEQPYRDFGKLMNEIMATAGGERVMMGMSLGGALAAYMRLWLNYDRILIANPVVRGHYNTYFNVANWIPGVRSWEQTRGKSCEQERLLGRAGVCGFLIKQGDAMLDFSFQNVRKWGRKSRAFEKPGAGSVHFTFTEDDPEVQTKSVQLLAKRMGLDTGSKYICGLPKAFHNSWLSPFDKPTEDKYWLNEMQQKVLQYLAHGTALEQQGKKDASGWPKCEVKCTPATCSRAHV